MAAIVLASGCGDDGDGSGSAATETTTAGPTMASAGTEDPSTTAEPSTGDAPTSTGDEPTTGSPAVSYAADIQPIWDARCTLGCHQPGGSGTMQTNLDLSAGVSYAQLVDVLSSQAPALPRVSPADLEGSYLWHKLKNTQSDVNGSGFQMPAGGLADTDLAKVEKWIEDGALP